MMLPDALIGLTLGGTYQVLHIVGQGGMGFVYCGEHVRTRGKVAIKILRPEVARCPEVFRRFLDEARIASALSHPNIVRVLDVHDTEGLPFLVMEWLVGEDLEQRLRSGGTLPLFQVFTILAEAGSALSAAHEAGVVHRDIKPANLFLCAKRSVGQHTDHVKVLDFGVSKIPRTPSQATRNEVLLGTPAYMSPEAARGEHDRIDGRTDQWALAVIAYRALGGRLPFVGAEQALLYQVVHEEPPPLRQLAPWVPAGIAAAIERALSKRPEDRFPGLDAFVAAFAAALPRPAPRPSTHRPLVWAALSLAGVGTLSHVRPPSATPPIAPGVPPAPAPAASSTGPEGPVSGPAAGSPLSLSAASMAPATCAPPAAWASRPDPTPPAA